MLAALSDGPSRLIGVLRSRDTTLMRAGLTTLGARLTEESDGTLVVQPIAAATGGGTIDVGLAGTVLRFLPAVAVLAEERTAFVGDPAAAARPVAPLLDALVAGGASISTPRQLPFTVAGGGAFHGGDLDIDASGSSQFISALLLAGARYRDGVRVHHVGESLPSRPHIVMTATMLARHGVAVHNPDEFTWLVSPGPIRAADEIVEPDLTNAASFLAAAVITGGELTTAWPTDSVQAADELADVLAAFGGELRYRDTETGRELTVSGSGARGAEVDLHAVSELTPVAAALAAVADAPSLIRGVAHIRGHETDRLKALATELGKVGAQVRETADGLAIEPGSRRRTVFATYADHRMAHAGALIGLVTPGIELDDVACTTKTMPDFPGLWSQLVGARQ